MGSATLRAVVWALAGALVVLFLVVDPFGVSPVDGWLGVSHEGVVGNGNGNGIGSGVELWTCPMHPSVVESEPGKCPVCGMDLVKVKEDAGHGDHDGNGNGNGHGHGLWTCPMHPDIVESEPGKCPICGMDLVNVKSGVGNGNGDGDGHGARKILFYRSPMDPSVTSPEPRKDEMGMDYVPVYADEAVAAQGAVVSIDPAVQQNMNVVTERVARRDIAHEVRTVGSLDYDQERMVSVTTKYPGFIEKTYVNIHMSPNLFSISNLRKTAR